MRGEFKSDGVCEEIGDWEEKSFGICSAACDISSEMSYYMTSREVFNEYTSENLEFSGNGSIYCFRM